ncbi:MAG TPA: hypothetical protein PKA88_01260 [Polyangiaceae bacterium]|nr:hypothetical protein [Polyangiaceae bacterium]HMR73710.1 hypothetical protein [Polyangiaceae bacterium]
MNPVLIALAITVVVEAPVVALCYPGERRRMALTCALTTGATNLAMNTLLFRWAGSYQSYLLIGEAGAALVEALVYFLVSRERDVGRALLASALANSLSYGVGLALF